MALVLPQDYRYARELSALSAKSTAGSRPLRVGILNLMPRAEAYERMLLRALGEACAEGPLVAPVWLRLEEHEYRSSDGEYLRATYQTYAAAQAQSPLDGLIVTGAPVEELPYAEVRYWGELNALLDRAHREVACTVGLCWGAMALAYRLGVDKVALYPKLFGLLPLRGDHEDDDTAYCAQSRHSGLDELQTANKQSTGLLRVLAAGPLAGSTVLESGDQRLLMHLGHPEYTAERLLFEYQRDLAAGRPDVPAPSNIDSALARALHLRHGAAFFASFFARIAAARGAPPALLDRGI